MPGCAIVTHVLGHFALAPPHGSLDSMGSMARRGAQTKAIDGTNVIKGIAFLERHEFTFELGQEPGAIVRVLVIVQLQTIFLLDPQACASRADAVLLVALLQGESTLLIDSGGRGLVFGLQRGHRDRNSLHGLPRQHHL